MLAGSNQKDDDDIEEINVEDLKDLFHPVRMYKPSQHDLKVSESLYLLENAFPKGMLQTLRVRSPEDIERSQTHFGLNSKLRPHIKSFLAIFWSQIKNVMLVIFFLFAFVQTAMGMYYADFERGVVEGSSIFLAVFIVILGSSIA